MENTIQRFRQFGLAYAIYTISNFYNNIRGVLMTSQVKHTRPLETHQNDHLSIPTDLWLQYFFSGKIVLASLY